jgi:hypothetical protein
MMMALYIDDCRSNHQFVSFSTLLKLSTAQPSPLKKELGDGSG